MHCDNVVALLLFKGTSIASLCGLYLGMSQGVVVSVVCGV
jgi:hypothetical protein